LNEALSLLHGAIYDAVPSSQRAGPAKRAALVALLERGLQPCGSSTFRFGGINMAQAGELVMQASIMAWAL